MRWKYIFCICFSAMQACNNPSPSVKTNAAIITDDSTNIENISASLEDRHADSLALLQLTRNLFTWEEGSHVEDFTPLLSDKNDTAYNKLDLKSHTIRITELEKVGIFTDAFINNYNKIFNTINDGFKTGALIYNVGELPPYSNGAIPWCDCQDVPDNFVNKIWLMDLAVNGNLANYNWSWGDGTVGSVRAEKIAGTWKISYLSGFDYDGYVNNFQISNSFTGK